jgi:hypothetical protein
VIEQVAGAPLGAVAAVMVAIAYIWTSLARGDRGGARLWALAFLFVLGGATASVLELGVDLDGWTRAWVLALRNAFIISAAGCFLLGSLAYRRRPVGGPSYVVGALALLTLGVTLWTQQNAQQWPGQFWTLLAVALLAGAVCYQWARPNAPGGVMRVVHAVGFGVGAAASLASAAVLLVSPAFGSLRAVVDHAAPPLTILAGTLIAVGAFSLREGIDRDRRAMGELGALLPPAEFLPRMREALRRASPRLDAIAVIAVRVEGIGGVRRSFGADAADLVDRVVRSAVRSFSSPLSLVGAGDQPGLLFVITTSSTPADARRQAGLLYRGVVSRLVSASDLVVPEVGVGVALSSMLGYSAESLLDAAARAADTARTSDESSVVLAVPSPGEASWA